MNKRALVYLGLISATLAAAWLYIHTISSPSAPPNPQQGARHADTAQALQSISIIDSRLTTGSFNAKVVKGEQVQFLVYSNQNDSLIVKGLDTRVNLPANQSTLIHFTARNPGTHQIELDLAGTVLGSIEVLPE